MSFQVQVARRRLELVRRELEEAEGATTRTRSQNAEAAAALDAFGTALEQLASVVAALVEAQQ